MNYPCKVKDVNKELKSLAGCGAVYGLKNISKKRKVAFKVLDIDFDTHNPPGS